MAQSITMPKLGLTMTEGTISKWNKAEGDAVAVGEVLFVVSTDKLTYEYQSEVSGVLLKIEVPENCSIAVGGEVALVGEAGEVVSSRSAPPRTSDGKETSVAPAAVSSAASSAGKKKVVVIGGGPGGYVCAIRLAQLGADVTLVERERVGGTCLNVGCIPTKALVKSAELYGEMKHGADFGVLCSGLRVDWAAVQNRKNAVVEQLVDGVSGLLTANKVAVVSGEAHFLSSSAVEVSGRTIQADAFVIAAGSAPVIPAIPGIESEGIVTSTEALSFAKLPEKLLIVGGGVIGMEFACLYATLGVDVTVVEMMPAILPPADEEMGVIVRKRMEALGVKIHTSCKVTGFDSISSGVMTHVLDSLGRELQFSSDKVLLSIGRRADTAALNLDAAGVKAERGRIAVNKKMETSVRNIYAIGDCCSPIMLAHVASAEGEVAAENIMGTSCDMDYKTVPSCVYTLPEMAWVGMTEKAAVETGRKIKVGRFPLIGNGKSLIMNETDGMVKIIADEKYGEILGVHIVGPHATDLIVEGALALRLEATADEIISTVHAHPTVGEALAEATLDLQGRAIHLPPQA